LIFGENDAVLILLSLIQGCGMKTVIITTRRASKEIDALTLVEVLVVIVVVVVLVAIVLSALARRKAPPSRAYCQNNLKAIGIAFRTWEGDHNDKYPMQVSTNAGGSMEWNSGNYAYRHFQVMSNELNNPIIMLCPKDDRRPPPATALPDGGLVIGFSNISNTNISYFVSLDADETFPAMMLAGDRNLVTNGVPVIPGMVVIPPNTTVSWSSKMHNGEGNLLLADGSVQFARSAGLKGFVQVSGTNQIRLAVP
jgi:prepilin-type processing-associated H-X9-DG protein